MFDISKNIEDNVAEFKGQIIDIFEGFCEKNHITIDNPDKEEYDKENGYEPGENTAIIFGDDYDRIADYADDLIERTGGHINEEDMQELVDDMSRAFAQIVAERGHIDDIGVEMNNLLHAWEIEKEDDREF